MKFPALPAATAIALIAGATAAYAQGQQGQQDGKASPPAAQTDVPKAEAPAQKTTEPKAKADKGTKEKTDSAQTEPKEKTKGTAQSEPKEKTKGTAQSEPKEKTKGTAQTESKEKTKGTAQTDQPAPATKSTEGTKGATPAKDSTAAAPPASGERVQLSEQQRTTTQQTILKDQRVNRVTNVNFNISVGTRVPRQGFRLEVLPVAIFSTVPQYRNYRYFVVDEQICIVDPNSFEIVEIIAVSGQSAGSGQTASGGGGGSVKLVLSQEEEAIILGAIELRDDSTMGLGALTIGSDLPQKVELRSFPDPVVSKVSKLKGYRYFTAENRVAVIGPEGSKVLLVIEGRR